MCAFFHPETGNVSAAVMSTASPCWFPASGAAGSEVSWRLSLTWANVGRDKGIYIGMYRKGHQLYTVRLSIYILRWGTASSCFASISWTGAHKMFNPETLFSATFIETNHPTYITYFPMDPRSYGVLLPLLVLLLGRQPEAHPPHQPTYCCSIGGLILYAKPSQQDLPNGSFLWSKMCCINRFRIQDCKSRNTHEKSYLISPSVVPGGHRTFSAMVNGTQTCDPPTPSWKTQHNCHHAPEGKDP